MKISFYAKQMVLAVAAVTLALNTFPLSAAQGNPKAWKQYRDEGRKAVASNQTEVAEIRFVQALEEAERLGKQDRELIESLKDLAFLYDDIGKPDKAEPLFRRALQVHESIHGANRIESVDIVLSLAVVCRKLGKLDEAVQLLDRAQKTMELKGHPAIAVCHRERAKIHETKGELDQAEAFYKKALEAAEAKRSNITFEQDRDPAAYSGAFYKHIYAQNFARVAGILQDLGRLYQKQKRFNDAEPVFQRLLKVVEKELSKDRDSLAMALNRVAEISLAQKKYPEAEAALKRLLTMAEKPAGIWPVYIAEGYHRAADLEMIQHKSQEADGHLEQLLALQLVAAPNKAPRDMFNLLRLANYYVREGNREDGEALLMLAVQTKQKAWGDSDPRVAPFLNLLARFFMEQKENERAGAVLQQSLGLIQKPGAGNTLAQVATLGLLVDAFVRQEKQSEAIQYMLQMATVIEQDPGATQPEFLPALERLIKYFESGQRFDRAGKLQERVIAIKEKQLGADNVEVADAVTKLGTMYLEQKNYPQAEKYLTRSLTLEEKARGPENMALLPSLAKMVTLYTQMGKDAELEAIYKKQIVISEGLFGAQNAAMVKPLEEYSAVLKRLKRDAEAEKVDARIKAIKGQ